MSDQSDFENMGVPPRPSRPNADRRQRRRPLQDMEPEKKEQLGKGLQQLFKGREEKYMPVTRALEKIGLEPKLMDVMIGDETVQCFVIPCQELIYKEWQFMTGGQFTSTAKREGTDDGE